MRLLDRRRALMATNEEKGGLPSGYQQVEWIANTRVSNPPAYITAGKIFQDVYPIKIRAKWYRTGGGNYNSYLVDFRTDSNLVFAFNAKTTFFMLTNAGVGHTTGFEYANNEVIDCICELPDAETCTLKFEKNGEVYTETYSPNSVTSFSNYTLTLFYIAANNAMKGRLYLVEAWQNNIKVADFIPCYRISDGAIGMYDLITKTFYPSTSTSPFGKGPDVN